MSRVFAYCRVSTSDQTADNQVREIKVAGFNIEGQRIITERISGSVQAMERPGFAKLMYKLEAGDVLVVTKLDRLGRNAIDVRATIERLAAIKADPSTSKPDGVKVHCLALGGVDLTSAAGKMTMQVIAAVAEFERDLLIERTQAGLSRAKTQGKHCGRPPTFTQKEQDEITQRIASGESISSLAQVFKTSRQTIMRVRDKKANMTAA